MAWIDTRKTDYGFEYTIGTIPIARAKWVRTAGESWKLHVATLGPGENSYTESGFDVETMPLSEVTKYLHSRLERPMPIPEID